MPPPPRRLSFTTVRVLQAIADGIPYGFDIMDSTSLPSGTVYPILARLEEQGLVRSRWEAVGIAQREKRPPRRYYDITAPGKRAMTTWADYYRTLGRPAPVTVPRPGRT